MAAPIIIPPIIPQINELHFFDPFLLSIHPFARQDICDKIEDTLDKYKPEAAMKQHIFNLARRLENHMTFQTRLLAAFFFVATPVLIIISIGLYLFLNSSAQENTLKTMTQTLERTQAQIENIIKDTENLSRNIIYDADVQKLLNEAAGGESYPETEAVKYFINSFIVNRDYIESVVITGLEDTLFSTEKAYTDVSTMSNIRQKWWYPQLEQSTAPYHWYPSAKSTQNDLTVNQSLMLTRMIRSTADYRTPTGRMMIYLKEDYVNYIWDSISWGQTLDAWLMDEQGCLLLKNNHAQCTVPENISACTAADLDSSTIIKINSQRHVVGWKTLNDNNWKLVLSVPLSEVNENRTIIFVQVWAMILLLIIIVTLVSLTISRMLSRPIRQISRIMDNYHNHTDTAASDFSASGIPTEDSLCERRDEIGIIYQSYRQMVNRVDTLIREIYLKDLEKKDAELALMQSQINPHFLYNTLDSINWMAMANGQDEISEMVTALSDTFRLSLKRTNSAYIPVSQEIEYLSSYLTLQKYRFGGQLSYSFHIQDEVNELYLLRFLLQPVVENSIKHGIRQLDNGGTIDITMSIRNRSNTVQMTDNTESKAEYLEIHMINDGCQIDLGKMKQLLEFDAATQTFLSFDQGSYGLQNINRRIKIVHGPDYGLKFSITKNQRTDCCIMLPVIRTDTGLLQS